MGHDRGCHADAVVENISESGAGADVSVVRDQRGVVLDGAQIVSSIGGGGGSCDGWGVGNGGATDCSGFAEGAANAQACRGVKCIT